MSVSAVFPDPSDEPGHAEKSDGVGDPSASFAAARRRLEARKSREVLPDVLSAEAILELAPEDRPVVRYLRGRNARSGSRKTYLVNLRSVQRHLIESGFKFGDESMPVESFPWHMVGPIEAIAFADRLASEYSNLHTVGTLTIALRSVIRECARLDLISYNRRDQVLDRLPVRAVRPGRTGREISDEELGLLFDACEQGQPFLAARDAAMLAIAVSTGMRGCELVDLDVGDINYDDGSMYIDRMKGGRPHMTWLHPVADDCVKAWLAERGTEPGPLLSSKAGGRLVPQTLLYRARVLRERAGIEKITMHDFRRTCITKLLRNGIDPFVVARIVGHKKVTTTLIYDRRTDLEDRQAVQALELGVLGRFRRQEPT